MTLPVIVNNVKANILKQQFKKVYNTFSNALLKTYSDNGNEYLECYYGEVTSGGECVERDENGNCTKQNPSVGYNFNIECGKFYDELKNSLNVIKVCENNALRNGCVSEDMKGIDTVYKGKHEDVSDVDLNIAMTGCNNFREENIKNVNPAWVLADGTVVGFYSSNRLSLGKIFWVDVNGHKKPNKWGYDIFVLAYRKRGESVILKGGGCFQTEVGGTSADNMIKSMY